MLLQAAVAQQLYFPPNVGTTWDTLAPSTLGYCPNQIDSLYDYLENTDSKAFILLKDGKIVLEKYFGTFTQDSVWYWASAGKSLTACLVGIAQQEGYLSIEDTSSQYLGAGWTAATPAQEQAITIKSQLSMATGLDDGVPEVDCTLDTCLQYLTAPWTRWAYHNAPYTLLDQVIEQATGRTINTYFFQKLRQTIGMTGTYLRVGYNNVFFSKPRSMARFGLLALNQGNWNGTTIVDTAYFREMVTPSQSINPSYGYLWWLNGQSSHMLPRIQFSFNGSMNPHAPNDAFMALGKDGQAVNVVPSQNLVWIRMGNSPNNSLVLHTYNDTLWMKINELICSPIATTALEASDNLQVFPNPTENVLQVQSQQTIQTWQLYNQLGQVVQQQTTIATPNFQVDLSQQVQGCYYLQVWYENGQRARQVVVKK